MLRRNVTSAIAGARNALPYLAKLYRLAPGKLRRAFTWSAVNAFAFLIYNSPFLGKRVLQRWYWKDNGAIILFYHEIDSQTFDSHVRWLKKHWQIISIDTLLEHIQRQQELENCVVITFDDASKSHYTEVLPIIRKYQIPVTLYLESDIVGTEREFWWVTVNNLRAILTDKQVRLRDPDYYETIPNKQKNAEISQAIERLKYVPQSRCALSFAEITEMLDSQLVTLGSHSKTHPCLNMTEREEAEEEIIGSKGDLELKLKVTIAHFAYPYGYYDESHIEMVKRGGYASAVTTTPGVNNIHTDPYQLGRLLVAPRANEYTLSMMVTGLWHQLGLDRH